MEASSGHSVEELEAHILDLHDGYRHMLREERERTLGLLDGELSRWLKTALAALNAEPPRIPVIRERLEDAIAVLARETTRLESQR
jgi:hypothetical protein